MEMERRGDEDVSLHLLLLQKEGCLIQILLWLPVVSLLRFKAVCKSWRDLIQSSSFIDLHTTAITLNSSSSSEFGSFILLVLGRIFPPPNYYSCNYSSLLMLSSQSDSESESVSISGGGSNEDQEEEEEGPVVVVVVDDLGFDMDSKAIVGSCNGLVCLHDINFCCKPDQVSLWNPCTGQFMILPEAITIHRRTFDLVVFGFDVETKDYKVVQFTGLKRTLNRNEPEFCFCRAQVYNLSTDSWRLLEGITCLPGYPFDYPDSVLYLNGTCFFLAHFFYTKRYPCLIENDRFIISFDFTKEILSPIQLPDHHRDQDLCLCSLGDNKIALFTSPKPLNLFKDDAPFRNCEDFNIWVLNYERGSSSVNKDSWTKLHSFQIQLKSQYDWYLPRGISNDGKFALLTTRYNKKMNLYNFATKEVKRDFLSCGQVRSKAHAYKPSLVSVFSQVEMVQQQQQPIG